MKQLKVLVLLSLFLEQSIAASIHCKSEPLLADICELFTESYFVMDELETVEEYTEDEVLNTEVILSSKNRENPIIGTMRVKTTKRMIIFKLRAIVHFGYIDEPMPNIDSLVFKKLNAVLK